MRGKGQANWLKKLQAAKKVEAPASTIEPEKPENQAIQMILAVHQVQQQIKNENESEEIYLTINEGFKPKDFVEITTDLTSQNGERLII